MMHGSQGLTRNVVGIIGNVISLFLFLSPGSTFWKIWRSQSTEEFHPYPYLASAMNCMFWIFYGLPVVHPDSTLVITINSIGLFLELLFLLIFFYYTTGRNRVLIVSFLVGEIVLLAIVALVTLLCFHTHESRSMFVGVICVVFGIIMYASPLSVIGKVVEARNPESMPFWVCFAGFSNGVVWFIYAFLKTFDPFLATANGIGALFGLVQLFVYVYYTCIANGNGSEQSEEVKDDGEMMA